MADADEAEIPEESDTTEGGTEDTEGDNKTPVIGEEDNSDDNQTTEETPGVEAPAEETGDDVSVSNADASVSADTDAKLDAPTIIVKNGDDEVTDLTQALPNRAEGVTFEIAAVEGVTFKYTVGETAPTKDTGTTYSAAVPVAAPDQDAEGAVKINAIAVVTPEEGDAQISDVVTVTVKFAAKPTYNTISLSGESEETRGISVYSGDAGFALDKDTPFSIEDPEQRVYVAVAPKSDDTLYEVMYRSGDKEEVWTSAYSEKVYGVEYYRIPDNRLNENLELKVVNMRKITLDWQGGANWESVGISASAVREDSNNHGNQIVFGDRLKDPNDKNDPYENKIYAPKNTRVELTISALSGQNVQLSKVALKKGADAAVDQPINEAKTSTFVVSEDITDDYTLTIDGTAGYQRVVLQEWDAGEYEKVKDIIPDKNKAYAVDAYKTYRLFALDASGKQITINKVTADGNDVASSAFNKKVIDANCDSEGIWILELGEEASGNEVKLELYVDAAAAEPVDTLTLKVAPEIKGVTIKGATGDKIAQQIGTVAKYALTPDTKLSKDSLSAAVEKKDSDGKLTYDDDFNESIANVKVENGSLVVTTKAAVKAQENAGTIAILNGASGKKVATVTLETKAPAWVTAKPSLKQAGATDTQLILDITAPKGVVLPDEEYDSDALLFYEVTANEKGKTEKKTKYVEVTGQTTRFTFKVNDTDLGKGKKADYEVTATLFLYSGTWNGEGQKPDGTEIAKSALSAVLKSSTRDPYYADKITLKKEKAASALYTGQENVHVATVDFGKSASYNTGADVEIYDIPEGIAVCDVGGEWRCTGETAVLADDLKVIVSAGWDVTPGKYTIKARTTYNKDSDNAGSSIVQATASVPVTVVQGIYDISATAPGEIYKADNKAATAKITVTYNENDKAVAPKTKKAIYDLVEEEWSDEVITVPGITVANGTIKIDKTYQIKSTKANPYADRYTVRVKAADYADNETADWVTFEVTGTAASFGKTAIVKYENGGYKDLAPADGTEIPINELDGAEVIVVKPNRNTVHGKYMKDDRVSSALYTLTPAKGTSIRAVEGHNYISATKLGKNLVFKATATDGSKVSVTSNKFSIVYDDSVPTDKVNVVYETNLDFGTTNGLLKKDETVELADVPAGTLLTLRVADEDERPLLELLEDKGSIFDYTLSAKNAKVVKKYSGGLALDVIVNKNPAEITLKKGKDEVGTYKIEIPQLGLDKDKTKELNDKTPKISLKKGTKIYPNMQDQELAFTMNKAVEGARFVKVSFQNCEDDTELLSWALMGHEAVLNANVKEFAFGLNLDGCELKKGASLAFVFLDRDRNVITKTTNTIKIKTTALKKSYKLNAKYTLSTKDAFRVPLSGKGNGVTKVEFKKLYNANIKGKINQFRNGFTLSDGNLELRTYYDEAAKETKAVAEQAGWMNTDFTGFVEYTVFYEDGSEDTFVTKIQVNLKKTDKNGSVPTANKYAASAVNVLNPGDGKTTEGVSYVTTGKINADIRAAKIVYTTGSGSSLEDENSPVQVKKVSGNEITLTIKGAVKNQSYKGKIYVLPLNGMYAYDNNYMTWDVNAWKKYGVEMNYNVSLKAANSKGKIKNPAKSVSFLDVAPKKLAVDGVGKEYYYAELPYTAGIFAQIDDKNDKITLMTKNNPTKDPAPFAELEKGLIKVRKVSNKNALGLYIDAEAFKAVVNDNGNWSGATFPKIEMTVHFVGETPGTKPNQYTAAPPESFTFSLTMPNPWSAISTNESRLVKVIAAMNGANAKIDGIASSSYDALEREVLVIANEPDVEIKQAVDAKKEAMVDELLKDAQINSWVSQLESFKVVIDWNDSTQLKREILKGDKTNKQFLILVVDAYTDRLIKQLDNEHATWGELAGGNGRTIELNIAAKSKTGTTEEAYCNVTFKVDEEAGKDNLDRAIERAVKRMNSEEAIRGISGTYRSATKTIAIWGKDPEMDFIDSKNQGRDKTVEILLSELGEYMGEVRQIEFTHEHEGIRDSITVKREGREATEQYIADLVDKWTDKLVVELAEGYEDDGNPNAYGRLRGEKLFVTATFENGETEGYTIEFDCPEHLVGLDSAISSAVRRLNKASGIPGVSHINYNASTKTIAITGNDAGQEIIESKDIGRESTVRILLEEMEGYMNEVSEVTFTHHEENVRDSITVKRDDHESTETYISNLVDEWTKKLAGELTSQGRPATYGSLDGKALEMTVNYSDTQKPKRTYTISFTIVE
ncbi:MAG: hypothetical protein K2M20_10860 [Lachnospiraceae bacterium]|nr:hypothetical protein [Lachnospiraceae bacterium]